MCILIFCLRIPQVCKCSENSLSTNASRISASATHKHSHANGEPARPHQTTQSPPQQQRAWSVERRASGVGGRLRRLIYTDQRTSPSHVRFRARCVAFRSSGKVVVNCFSTSLCCMGAAGKIKTNRSSTSSTRASERETRTDAKRR